MTARPETEDELMESEDGLLKYHPAVRMALREISPYLSVLQQDALQAESMLTAISSMMGDPRRDAMVTCMVEELIEITKGLNSKLESVNMQKAIAGAWLGESVSEAAE